MNRALTYDEVKAFRPCSESFCRVSKLLGGMSGWNGNRINAADARTAGCTFDDIVWIAATVARKTTDVERRLRLWMADCSARVLHIYEETGTSAAPRNAIIAARRFARGEIDATAKILVEDAVWDVVRDTKMGVARDAARAAAWPVVWDAVKNTQWDASIHAEAAAKYAARAAASDAEEVWQFDRLIARLADDEPEDVPLRPI